MTEQQDNQEQAQPEITAEMREAARARAMKCGQELADLLAKHRCRIVPYIAEPEPVGRDGAKLMIQAAYGIIPDISTD